MRIRVDPEPRYLGYGKSVCLRVKAKALANSDLAVLQIYVSEPGTGLVRQLL